MKPGQYRFMSDIEDHHWWFLAKRQYAQAVLSKNAKNLKILDVGCGTGGMSGFIRKWGEVTGVEPAGEAYPFLKKRQIRFIPRSFHQFRTKTKFDLICFFDVLYHRKVVNDREALTKAYGLLKPGGYLLITDCAFPFLTGPHDRMMYARQRYKLKELSEKVTTSGFEIHRASYIFMVTFPLFVVSRMLQKLTSKTGYGTLPEYLNSFLIKLCNLESKVLKYINLPFGSSIIILARHP